jgi:hypothetical protein
MLPTMLTLASAEKLIIAEWNRWAKKRGASAIIDMQVFYFTWLKKSRPELLMFKCHGDQWQVVLAWLRHDEVVK